MKKLLFAFVMMLGLASCTTKTVDSTSLEDSTEVVTDSIIGDSIVADTLAVDTIM